MFSSPFQYRCDYKGSVPTHTHFFCLFKARRSLVVSTKGHDPISLRKSAKIFYVYLDNVNYFKDWLFLVTLLHEKYHATIFFKNLGSPYQSSNIFSKFWRQSHLAESGSHVYKMDNLTHGDILLRRKLVSFYEALS